MFRKPMRLEKWIAFDGAGVADVVEAVEAVDAGDQFDDDSSRDENFGEHGEGGSEDGSEGEDRGSPVATAFMFAALGDISLSENVDAGAIGITYPSDAANGAFPLQGSDFTTSASLPSGDVFFEITMPDDGGFILWSYDDRNAFVDQCNPSAGGWYAFDNGDNTFTLHYYNGGYDFSDTGPGGATGGSGQLAYSEDGALRFHLLEYTGGDANGNGTVNSVLASVVCVDGDGNVVTAEGYQINSFYKEGAGGDATLFHSDGIYNANADGVTVLANDPGNVHTNQGQWNNETSPGSGGSSGTEFPPVNPPGGDGDSEGEAEETGDDAGESGDSPADAPGGDDPVYIYRRDESPDEEYGDRPGPGDDADAEAVVIELVESEDGAVASAAGAMALELVRDLDALLHTMRTDREVLLQSLTALQLEYLRRGFGHDGPVRDFLRELFEMGEWEKTAINRVIAEMRRHVASFATLSPAQRDGMLLESLRELRESAERRSGEMGALSQALEAVVELLGRWNENGLEASESEARELFDRVYAEAMAAWREKAERLDPMGRELSASERGAAAR